MERSGTRWQAWVVLGIGLLALGALGFYGGYWQYVAYDFYLDDVRLGRVADRSDAKAVLERTIREAAEGEGNLGPEVTRVYRSELRDLSARVRLEPVHGPPALELTPPEELAVRLREELRVEPNALATALVIDGETVAILEDEQTARAVVDRVRQEALAAITAADGDGTKREFRSVEFVESVEYVPGRFPPDRIEPPEQVATKLLRGTDRIETHTVERNETLWTIASKNHMTEAELRRANPQLGSSSLIREGDRLSLVVPDPYLTLRTEELVTYTEPIPYKTKVVYDPNLWPWERIIRSEGKNGARRVTVAIEREGGVVVTRHTLSEEVIEEPRQEVVAQGSRQVPPQGSGNLLWPAQGPLTSHFGWRSLGWHSGVDISLPIGTPVRAADAGTVVKAGRDGGYGLMVAIDHGGGMVTVYGHLSAVQVPAGRAVEKGTVIGLSGNTGRSTGPHLHYEIRLNGRPVDPLRVMGR